MIRESLLPFEGGVSAGKFLRVNWGLVLVVGAVAAIGTVMLYSAAGGSWTPWAKPHLIRFGACLVLLLLVAVIDVRIWWRYAYLIYAALLALLVAVEFVGATGMGARRWIDLAFFRLQPSELMKIGLVLALARYFHRLPAERIPRVSSLLIPGALIVVPAALVLRQPDLGTAIFLLLIGLAVFLGVGVRFRVFVALAAVAGAAIPAVWSLLRSYQQQRILSFLDPERDAQGAGYHILQSKIALGAGGFDGKGFLQGSQSQLRFLPEIHTDFIFAMLGEEFGMAGGLVLIALYGIVIAFGIAIALRARNHFGRVLSLGVSVVLFIYVFINIAMVMGLIPVVGVPLPLISYGGTAMLAMMLGVGLMISVYVHRDTEDLRAGSRRWR